jgi:gas vesicle protein
MKKISMFFVAALFSMTFVACDNSTAEETTTTIEETTEEVVEKVEEVVEEVEEVADSVATEMEGAQ